jgi:hypothetical protein
MLERLRSLFEYFGTLGSDSMDQPPLIRLGLSLCISNIGVFVVIK